MTTKPSCQTPVRLSDHIEVENSHVHRRLGVAHRAQSREAFASGALRAAAWLAGRAPGRYSMRDVLLTPES